MLAGNLFHNLAPIIQKYLEPEPLTFKTTSFTHKRCRQCRTNYIQTLLSILYANQIKHEYQIIVKSVPFHINSYKRYMNGREV